MTLCALGQWFSLANAQPLTRVANATLRLPERPPLLGYTTVDAFPGLSFANPVAIASAPGETNRLFVAEQGGVIYAITNLANPTKSVFLDLSDVVVGGTPQKQQGLQGLALHPGFATNGYFYVAYVLLQNKPTGDGYYDRVARFQSSPGDPNQASRASEIILIDQFDQNETHNLNDLKFGPDGYLYIASGDEGDPMDYLQNSQRIDRDFFSGILRIDVDRRPGNLLPNPHPASSTNYLVPADNPFVWATVFNGQPVDPTQVRTEFYAVGLRNPWRMAFDPVTGLLYCGDVGESAWEEVNVIVKGGNYGWAYLEATHPGPRAAEIPAGFTSVLPILEYPHGNGFYAGHSVIGGVVYRGSRLRQLTGAYVFADYVSGNIWRLEHDGTVASSWERLTHDKDIASFGLDPRTGDVLLADLSEGKIKRLEYNDTPSGPALPPTLADAGAFADLATLQPHPGIVPYELNVPFWSDGAIKTRWFSLPNLTLKIGFSAEGNWSFPTGTVWIKHFELQLTNGVSSSARRLETRLLVKNSEGVYGITYRWGDSLDNATLVPEEGLDETFVIQDGSMVRTQLWHYPARSECVTCHTPVGGYALGFSTAQLNRDFNYNGDVTNQIKALSDAGYFDHPVSSVATLRALAPASALSASLEDRARSYLQANCVYCHQPGGAGGGFWDARIATPPENAGLLNGLLRENDGDPAKRVIKPGSLADSMLLARITTPPPRRMPPLATSEFDRQASSLITEWITSLPPVEQPPPPAPPTGLRATASFGQVRLNWAASLGATAYIVKRSNSSGAGHTSVATNESTVFTDTGLINDTNYFYVVVALNAYDQSAYSAEVRASPSSRPVPVVKVSFDELTGPATPNLGTVGGTFSLTTPLPERSVLVPTNVGGARSVDFRITADDYAVDGDTVTPALGGLERFTITGWLNNRDSNQGPGGNRVVSWLEDGRDGVDLAYKSDGSLVLGVNQRPDGRARSSAGVIPTDIEANSDSWRFFAVTYDATAEQVQFFFGSNANDAALDVALSYTGQGPAGTNIGRLSIGNLNPASRAGASGRMFRGLIDDIQIYTNVLSLAEIIAVQRTVPELPPPLPTLSVFATKASASEPGDDNGILVISRTGPTTLDLVVNLAVAGTATSGQDYIALSNTVVIPAQASSTTIEVVPLDDSDCEFPETVICSLLADPAYGIGSPSSAAVMIADDECLPPQVWLSLIDGEAAEAGPDPGVVRIWREGWLSSNLTVHLNLNGTARNGLDYVLIDETVTIPANSLFATVTVMPLDDTAPEDAETVVISLAPSAAYRLASPTSATVRLGDDDGLRPLVWLKFDDATAEVTTNSGAADASFTLTAPWPVRVDLMPQLAGNVHAIDMSTGNGNYAVDSLSPITALGGLSRLTVTGWLNNRSTVQSAGGNRVLCWLGDPSAQGAELVYRNDGSLELAINHQANGQHRSSSGQIPDDLAGSSNNWRFFAVTYDAINAHIAYYFGSNASEAAPDIIVSYPGVGVVGQDVGRLAVGNVNLLTRAVIGNRVFRGLIDDVRVYGEVLTLAQIVQVQHGADLHGQTTLLTPQITQIALTPEGQIYLQVSARPGQSCRILAGSTLTEFVPVSTNVVGLTGTFEYFEPLLPGQPLRFYRVTTP
jgi:glucose/arabinose dehydrogenase